MKRIGIAITSVVLLGVNFVLISSFSNGSTNCSGSGVLVDVRIRLRPEYTCAYSTCAIYTSDFDWNLLTSTLDGWNFSTQLFNENYQTYAYQYGLFNPGQNLVRYQFTNCYSLGPYDRGTGCEFKLQLKTQSENNLSLTLSGPCGFCSPGNYRATEQWSFSIENVQANFIYYLHSDHEDCVGHTTSARNCVHC